MDLSPLLSFGIGFHNKVIYYELITGESGPMGPYAFYTSMLILLEICYIYFSSLIHIHTFERQRDDSSNIK